MNDKINLLDISDFKKLKLIGEGSFSTVFTAQETKTGKIYAAKIYKASFDESDLEYDKIIELFSFLSSHPHKAIVKIYGITPNNFYNEDSPVLFTEYMRKGSLQSILFSEKKKHSPAGWNPTKKLINIFGIASAMKFLHSHQILYRDLKPGNVLEDENFYPKICDFDYSIKKTDVIAERQMVGTMLYTAPEIFIGNEIPSYPSDVFSFAMTLFAMLVDTPTTFGKSKIKTSYKYSKKIIDGERPTFTVEIPESYRKLIEDCWKQSQSDRPTFDEIVSRLKTDKGFITSEIDEKEYLEYIRLVESNEPEKEDESQTSKKEEEEIEVIKLNPFSIDVKNLNLKNFVKENKIGYGFAGDVYKIKSKSSNIVYAAKIFRNEIYQEKSDTKIAQNLFREVKILSELSHPSIMKFYGYSGTDFIDVCRPVIITEYLCNGSLEDLIEMERSGFKSGFWNETTKLIIIYGIAKGLSYLHKKCIIHRDLKPVNILVDDFLFPKLADFGFSKHLNEEQELIEIISDLEESGIMGTIAFIAPEIWKKAKYSKSGDVYAFGVLVYELITLEIPFYGFDKNVISYAVVSQQKRPKFTKSTPIHYKELIEDCWNQKASKRPTFDEILIKLETDQRFTEKVDKRIFNNYINYIKERETKNSIENNKNKYSFQKYSLEEMHKELKDSKSILIEDGIVNIESYFSKSEIYRSDFSCFYEISNKLTGEICSAEISNINIANLNLKEKQQIANEVSVLTKLNHPSIQRIIGYSFYDFEHQQNPVIIRENSSNLSLFDLLEKERKGIKNKQWTETKKLINIYGIASGMKYLHSNDIIHHELNSKNIFVDSNLNPKITEFGLFIKPQNSCRMSNHSIISNENKISYFVAPEILQNVDCENDKNKEKASDVYSFAFIVYEIITNKIPFLNIKNQNQFFNEVVNKISRPSLLGIPSKYSNLISSCWSANPNERPTFEAIVKSLQTDKEFINDQINEDEFIKYINMLEQNKQKNQ